MVTQSPRPAGTARRPLLASLLASRLASFLAVLLLFAFAACSGPRPVVEPPPEKPEELPEPTIRLSDYEDFDAAPFREAPPVAETDVAHDVPAQLMDGRTTGGATTTVNGFRVQVYSTLDRAAAINLEEEARAWWRLEGGSAPGVFGTQLPIYTVYLQPYYRVRIGNFRTRAEAERARALLANRFPDAFIVPDRVTVPR